MGMLILAVPLVGSRTGEQYLLFRVVESALQVMAEPEKHFGIFCLFAPIHYFFQFSDPPSPVFCKTLKN